MAAESCQNCGSWNHQLQRIETVAGPLVLRRCLACGSNARGRGVLLQGKELVGLDVAALPLFTGSTKRGDAGLFGGGG